MSIALFFIASVFLRKFLISIGQQESLRTITFARLDSITCGVTVAYINTVLKPALTVKRAGFVIGIVLLLTPIVVVAVTGTPFEKLYNNSVLLFLLPLGASLILPFVSLLNSPSMVYGNLAKVVEKISLWSYSIYLSHIPLMWSIYYLLDGSRATPYGNLISKVVALAITVTASALIFKYWETPITRFRPKELKS
jgi:peptidoglycan/LPS O-acetylase OafA/YrhL